jgi:hypothetical protein
MAQCDEYRYHDTATMAAISLYQGGREHRARPHVGLRRVGSSAWSIGFVPGASRSNSGWP